MIHRIALCLLSFTLYFSVSAQDPYLFQELNIHKDKVQCLDFSFDGNYLASGGDDKALYITSLTTFEVEYAYEDNYFALKALEFTKNNYLFVSAGSDIKQINMNNETQKVFKGNTTHIWSIDYAPERNKLTAGSYDFKIKVWDVPSESIFLTLEGHEKSTLPVAFSPDEKYIVSGSLDKTVKVWNAQTGECMKTLERHTENIYDVEFHPTGKYFASASGDHTIRLWNIETGEVVKTYAGHEKGVLDIEFSPDGEHLFSASFDGTIILWQTRTGKKLYSFVEHEGTINTIAISKDGNYMASGGDDKRILLWKLGKRIYIENGMPEKFEEKFGDSYLTRPRRKGESKKEYEERMLKAEEHINEFSEEMYSEYIKSLKSVKLD